MNGLILCLFLLIPLINKPTQEKGTLEIKYLYGNNRCESCQKIERAIKKTIYQHFPEQAREKRIVFVSLNIDEDENKALAVKYEIWGSALILKSIKDGKAITSDISEIAHQNVNNEKLLIKRLKEEFDKYLK